MASQTTGAVDDRFRSLYADRPRQLPDLALAQQSALRTVNHLQTLVYRAPRTLPVVEHVAEHLREPLSRHLYLAYPLPEDTTLMSPRKDDEDVQEAARRLIDWVQVYTPKRPVLIQTLDHVTRALVVEEGRQLVATQLQQMNPENVATMVAVAAQLMKNQDTTPSAGD